jgi:hypothetical protein
MSIKDENKQINLQGREMVKVKDVKWVCFYRPQCCMRLIGEGKSSKITSDSTSSVESDANVDPAICTRKASAQPGHLAVWRSQHALDERVRNLRGIWSKEKG